MANFDHPLKYVAILHRDFLILYSVFFPSLCLGWRGIADWNCLIARVVHVLLGNVLSRLNLTQLLGYLLLGLELLLLNELSALFLILIV